MSERIVDLLEAVEIEREQGARAFLHPHRVHRRGKATVNTVPVGKTGKRIVLRQARGLPAFLVTLGNVASDAAISCEFTLTVENGFATERPAAIGASTALSAGNANGLIVQSSASAQDKR